MSARVEKRETSQEELQRVITDPKLIRWFVVRLDETKYWDQSSLAELLQKECGRSVLPDKIYSTYLVSPDIGVHICSFQASVEAWFLESFPWWEESVDLPDDIHEYSCVWVQEGASQTELVTYFDHGDFFRDIDTSVVSGPDWKYIGHTSLPGTEDHDEERDALFEYERGNPSF
jgi:hypothetical protein